MAQPGLAFLIAQLRQRGVKNPRKRALEILEAQQGPPQDLDDNRPGDGQGDGADTTGGMTEPPPYTYDPAIDAERRAIERGLEDTLRDTALERKYARKDFKVDRRSDKLQKRRTLADLLRESRRGTQDIGLRTADVQQRAARGQADFTSQLQDLSRRFNTLGQNQAQNANAAGVLEGGTMRAAAAKRASNEALAQAPILTASQRLGQDTQTALNRLAIDQTRLNQDIGQDRFQTRQDFRFNRRLAGRDLNRDLTQLKLERQRAKREALIGDTDLLSQAIYQARANRPGVFSKSGSRKGKRNR